MPTYRLTCEMLPSDKELAVAAWDRLGMLGCEESSCDRGVRVSVYFADLTSLQAASYDLMRYLLFSPIETALVDDQDWNAQWRATMQPVKVTEAIWVSPSWLKPPLVEGETWIRIEPKMAFGTGHHETTRLAAQALAALGSRVNGRRVLDVGCGSGVLCFVAGILGASGSVGLDIDPDCAGNLSENRRDNPSPGHACFAVATTDAFKLRPEFDVAVMNMILTESEPCLAPLTKLLRSDGILVWSGLLAADRDAALSAASRCGFVVHAETAENEWMCGVFVSRASQ